MSSTWLSLCCQNTVAQDVLSQVGRTWGSAKLPWIRTSWTVFFFYEKTLCLKGVVACAPNSEVSVVSWRKTNWPCHWWILLVRCVRQMRCIRHWAICEKNLRIPRDTAFGDKLKGERWGNSQIQWVDNWKSKVDISLLSDFEDMILVASTVVTSSYSDSYKISPDMHSTRRKKSLEEIQNVALMAFKFLFMKVTV